VLAAWQGRGPHHPHGTGRTARATSAFLLKHKHLCCPPSARCALHGQTSHARDNCLHGRQRGAQPTTGANALCTPWLPGNAEEGGCIPAAPCRERRQVRRQVVLQTRRASGRRVQRWVPRGQAWCGSWCARRCGTARGRRPPTRRRGCTTAGSATPCCGRCCCALLGARPPSRGPQTCHALTPGVPVMPDPVQSRMTLGSVARSIPSTACMDGTGDSSSRTGAFRGRATVWASARARPAGRPASRRPRTRLRWRTRRWRPCTASPPRPRRPPRRATAWRSRCAACRRVRTPVPSSGPDLACPVTF
jgi:hypothetical protein